MEVTKLYNVSYDLVNENLSLKQSELITNLTNSIAQNQTAQIEKYLLELEDTIAESKSNTFSFSAMSILREIDGIEYFGIGSLTKIKQILNESPFNNALTVQKLQEYEKNRTAYIKLLTDLNSIFKKLNFAPHFYDDEIFEVGLILPDTVTENKVVNITKSLHKWDQIFKTLKEITGEDVEDTKISLVNNGSFEFFFENSVSIALCISLIVERIATLYKRIIEIRIARHKLAELGAPKVEITTIEQHESNEIDKEIKAIVTQIMKDYSSKIESGRKNELKTALTNHIKYIAKSIDKGVQVEVTPPEVTEPEILQKETTEENKQDKEKTEKKHKETLAKIELINKSNELAREIIKTGSDVFKYLTTGENNEDEEKN